MFALLAAPIFAYDVAILVTVSQDTLAVGTNVTIVKDGVRLYDGKAGADGVAQFPLDAGSYFVLLDRGGYPRHVNLLEVTGSQNVTYTMRQLISYASAYGQVSGPSEFTDASVAAYSNGNIVKRATPNKDGYYLMSFLPEGEYSVDFSAPGFDGKAVTASLRQSDFSEINAALAKTVEPAQATPIVMAPGTAERQSVIEVSLVRGGQPMAGVKLTVETPAGSIEVTTGADGKAHVNAVQPGQYKFLYGNLTAVTVVEGANETTAAPPATTEPEQQAPSGPSAPVAGGMIAGAAVIGFVGLIIVVAAAIFIASRMGRKKQPEKKELPSEDAAAPHARHAHHPHHKK